MIYVFRTTVHTKAQARGLKPHLDQLLAGARWNFDLQDRDKVLRLDCAAEHVAPVVELLRRCRFTCEELE